MLINSLSTALRASGSNVFVCEGDADKMIAMKSIEIVQQRQHCTVVAGDTKILVTLIHMWDPSMSDAALRHEEANTIFQIPQYGREDLLFIHSCSVCDATSRTINQGQTFN